MDKKFVNLIQAKVLGKQLFYTCTTHAWNIADTVRAQLDLFDFENNLARDEFVYGATGYQTAGEFFNMLIPFRTSFSDGNEN